MFVLGEFLDYVVMATHYKVLILLLVTSSHWLATSQGAWSTDEILSSPMNVTLTEIEAREIKIFWSVEPEDAGRITAFEIIIQPAPNGIYSWRRDGLDKNKIVEDIDGESRTASITDLLPYMEYQLYIVAMTSDGTLSNESEVILFKTAADTVTRPSRVRVRPGEAAVVIFILVAWVAAIIVFMHQWGKIRILQPREPRYKHNPKNLESVKVVKRPTDSVIYKNYPEQLTNTMKAREKRIERMNTMPNIKINEALSENNISGAIMEDDNLLLGFPKLRKDISKSEDLSHRRHSFDVRKDTSNIDIPLTGGRVAKNPILNYSHKQKTPLGELRDLVMPEMTSSHDAARRSIDADDSLVDFERWQRELEKLRSRRPSTVVSETKEATGNDLPQYRRPPNKPLEKSASRGSVYGQPHRELGLLRKPKVSKEPKTKKIKHPEGASTSESRGARNLFRGPRDFFQSRGFFAAKSSGPPGGVETIKEEKRRASVGLLKKEKSVTEDQGQLKLKHSNETEA